MKKLCLKVLISALLMPTFCSAIRVNVLNVTPPFDFFTGDPMLRKKPVGDPLLVWAVGNDDKPVIITIVPFGVQVSFEYPYPLKTLYISNSKVDGVSLLTRNSQGALSINPRTYADAVKYISARPNQFYKFDPNMLQEGALFYILPTGLSSGLLSGSGPFLSAGVAAPLLIADKNLGIYWNRLMSASFGVYSGELMKYVYLNKLYAVLSSYGLSAAANAYKALERTRMELGVHGGITERDAAYANANQVPGI